MEKQIVLNYVTKVLENLPENWLNLTTHRLDIYNEKLAKTQFIDELEVLFNNNDSDSTKLQALPTAYDYIRLGHPLSCLLEWAISKLNGVKPETIISFSSNVAPILAILRINKILNRHTQIFHQSTLPENFKADILKNIYGYNFDLIQIDIPKEITDKKGCSIFISQEERISNFDIISPMNIGIDFIITIHPQYGSVILVNGSQNESFISEIQHFRRRETIAMTPSNCHSALKQLVSQAISKDSFDAPETSKNIVLNSIKQITETTSKPLIGSSGLSVQYAIMMGLVDDALENHHGKSIKFVVPPNCYGGTNDQARRVAASIEHVEVLDLPVDGGNDMVQSIDAILSRIAKEDAVPYIIAEIPTNPRVEVPDLIKLKEVLSKKRVTASGKKAIEPVFILDQTFCPNVHFLGEGEILSTVKAISYVSGSKFPSGGKCTAGYCVSNKLSEGLMPSIEMHLKLCDNEATTQQLEILSRQLPSMNQRIHYAYLNTRSFVNFIQEKLPNAKINFVSDELAIQGFTPSVFSLDLPTKGNTEEEKEAYKRELNHKLINLMITEIPNESKYCVSYGQLKGVYWTIPATSTQGTTKEGDKDYIARVALSPDMDLELHKKVFEKFVELI
jgi:cystathionine beta-lyase/cystathionine gamma-synthase